MFALIVVALACAYSPDAVGVCWTRPLGLRTQGLEAVSPCAVIAVAAALSGAFSGVLSVTVKSFAPCPLGSVAQSSVQAVATRPQPQCWEVAGLLLWIDSAGLREAP